MTTPGTSPWKTSQLGNASKNVLTELDAKDTTGGTVIVAFINVPRLV